MRILAIDPGPERSAWLILDDGAPADFSIDPNENVLRGLRYLFLEADTVVIEQVASYGMPVGAEVFETVFWSGRFAEACPQPVHRIPRLTVKLHLCHSPKANDSTIRQALIDRFSKPGAPAIGTKKAPGPLKGIVKDLWSALALAVTFADSQ